MRHDKGCQEIARFPLFSMVGDIRAVSEVDDDFIRWWLDTRPELERYARALGVTDAAAHDLAQDVALSLIRDRHRIDTRDRFRAFAFRRLAWLRLSDLRQRRHEIPYDADVHDASSEQTDPYVDQLHLALARAIAALPGTQRNVIESILRGETSREIASRLGISASTVRSHHRHAKLALSNALSDFAEP